MAEGRPFGLPFTLEERAGLAARGLNTESPKESIETALAEIHAEAEARDSYSAGATLCIEDEPGSGEFRPIADIEPFVDPSSPPPDFVLKARDALAPVTVARWIVEALTLHPVGPRDIRHVVALSKVAAAARHLAELLEWQAANGAKVPD